MADLIAVIYMYLEFKRNEALLIMAKAFHKLSCWSNAKAKKCLQSMSWFGGAVDIDTFEGG